MTNNYYENNNILFYNVKSDDFGHFGFYLDHKDMLVDIAPTINITDKKAFDTLVNEVLNTNFIKFK